MNRKVDQFVRQSQSAASEISKWPQWMQRNLEPPRVKASGSYRPAKGAKVASSKGDTVSPTKPGSAFVLKSPTKKKAK